VQVHAKVSGLPFDHFNNNTDGPLGWVTSGTADIDMYVELPQDDAPPPPHLEVRGHLPPAPFAHLSAHDRLWAHAGTESRLVAQVRRYLAEATQRVLARMGLPRQPGDAPAPEPPPPAPPRLVTTMLDLRLHNLRSSVPLQQGDWGYMDTTLLRPVIAYLNAKPTVLDLNATVVLKQASTHAPPARTLAHTLTHSLTLSLTSVVSVVCLSVWARHRPILMAAGRFGTAAWRTACMLASISSLSGWSWTSRSARAA
jgi:hypothetical protein